MPRTPGSGTAVPPDEVVPPEVVLPDEVVVLLGGGLPPDEVVVVVLPDEVELEVEPHDLLPFEWPQLQ